MSESTNDTLMIHRRGDVHVIEVMPTNVLDQHVINAIQDDIDKLIERTGMPKLLISFENVTHLASAMLGVLINVNKKVVAAKGSVRIVCVNPQIRDVFKLTRLDKVLKIFESTDKALVKF